MQQKKAQPNAWKNKIYPEKLKAEDNWTFFPL
jgi:hypothetical protein